MRLSVWILEADPLQVDQLSKRWKSLSPSFSIRTFQKSSSLLETAYKEGLPDIVAGEWRPGSDKGTEFMQRLRALGPVDLLPLTGDSSLLGFSRAMQYGCSDYLLKPFSNDRLRVSIERYCSRRHDLPVHRPLTQQDLDRALTFMPRTRTRPSGASGASSAAIPQATSKPASKTVSLADSTASSANPPTGNAGSIQLTKFRRSRLSAILRLLQTSPRGLTLSEITAAFDAEGKAAVSKSMILSDLCLLEQHRLVKRQPRLTGLPGRPPLLFSLMPKRDK